MFTEKIFKNKIMDEKKLTTFGFVKRGENFSKTFSVLEGEFDLIISIDIRGKVKYSLIENFSKEEYALIHVETVHGSYVEKIRNICYEILSEISEKCFEKVIFKSQKAENVISFIRENYNTEPEFLWEKFPEYAVFRRHDNKKWFAVIMNVAKKKIGLLEEGNIEIMNLKAPPETVEKTVLQKNFYPAFHMNKKHWFTISLEGEIPDEEIFKMIETSYKSNEKK